VRVYDVPSASAIHKVGSQILVFKSSGSSTQIWKLTASGQTLVKDIGAGLAYSAGAVASNVLYFAVGSDDYSHDHQLWRTDGTAAGTYKIGTSPGEWDRSRISHLMVLNNQPYFSGQNTTGGTSFFHVRTTSSIEKIAALPIISKSVVVDNHLVMLAGVDDRTEVYGSDGTTAGTQLLTTLNTLAYYDWAHTAVIGDYAYISDFQNTGDYVWRTNGTACGTYPVYPGTRENFGLAALGNDLVLGGYTIKTGAEPYIYHNINALAGTPACIDETSLTSIATTESNEEKHAELTYPNPFTNSFTFRIDDESQHDIEVGVFTIYGMPVENVKSLKSSTDYELGSGWAKGSYIIKIKTAEKTITHQVMKK
jgi:ELWxxDGT repeat protein